MFRLHKYAVLGAVLVGALLVFAVGGVGYRLGAQHVQAEWDAERIATTKQTADALAHLARQYQQAEARYAREAARKQQVVTQRVEVVRREIERLPSRDCPVRADARRLLVSAACASARNTDRPECLSSEVPTGADAAGGRGVGDDS